MKFLFLSILLRYLPFALAKSVGITDSYYDAKSKSMNFLITFSCGCGVHEFYLSDCVVSKKGNQSCEVINKTKNRCKKSCSRWVRLKLKDYPIVNPKKPLEINKIFNKHTFSFKKRTPKM